MKKVIIFILIIACAAISITLGLYYSNKYIEEKTKIFSNQFIIEQEEKENIIVELEAKEDKIVKMVAIGDIMCHNSQYNDAYKNGQYDFSYVFEDIKHYIEDADIAIGNLETTFAGSQRGYTSYPTFNTPEILAKDLKELGIDVLSTANNHSLDKGYQGIESTIDYIDEVGISHIGTYKSVEEQKEIVMKEVNGLKIAFLAYTYGTNGIPIPKEKEYCINLIDKELIIEHLNLAKAKNPDVICVNMHWGEEYQKQPNETQKELAKFLFENGVDIILGSHPHILQKMETQTVILPDETEKNTFVIYSLGNFMSGQTKENTRNSIILQFEIIKNGETDKITIENINYIPIYTYTYPNFQNYRVLDIRKVIQKYEDGIEKNIDSDYYNLLKKELEHIESLFEF